MFDIVTKRMLNDSTALLEIKAPDIAGKVEPGQFVILRIDQKGERIPLTVADFDVRKQTVTVIVQMIGYTTIALGNLNAGDAIAGFTGPLGKPSELGGYLNAAIIGGGVGCAIAYPQAKYLFNRGTNVDIVAGFRNKELVILEEEMARVCSNLYITTDDGSYAEKGFVTQKLQALIDTGNKYDLVLAIGPVVMMRAVSEVTRPYGLNTVVSLNPIMIDGTGMCGCCRVTVGNKTKFACVDGPDFNAHEVDFSQLIKRNSAYKKQESEWFEHACRIYGRDE